MARIVTPYLCAADVSGFLEPFSRDFADNARNCEPRCGDPDRNIEAKRKSWKIALALHYMMGLLEVFEFQLAHIH